MTAHQFKFQPVTGRFQCFIFSLCLAGAMSVAAPTDAISADENWNPFSSDTDTYRPPQSRSRPRRENNPDRRRLPTGGVESQSGTGPRGYGADPFPGGDSQYGRPEVPGPLYRGPAGNQRPGSIVSPVDSGELAPVVSEKSGLPFASWQGLSIAEIEKLLAPLELPLRSAALHNLWLRLFAADDTGSQDRRLIALRAEALYRAGHLDEAAAVIGTGKSDDASTLVLKARINIARGEVSEGCEAAKRAASKRTKIIKALRGEAVVLAGYCAIGAGNKAAAGLAADLARDEGYRSRFTLAVLDAIASGRTTRRRLPKQISALQFLLLKQAGFDRADRLLANASPSLLAVFLRTRNIAADVRLSAAEKAALRNIISGKALAEAYRKHRQSRSGGRPSGEAHRAQLFQEAENTPTPLQRTRTIRALIDDARRADLTLPVLNAVKPLVDQIRPAPEVSWFATTAIETMLAAGDYEGILPWLALAAASDRVYNDPIQHWRILGELVNPATTDRKVDLYGLEDLTSRGRFSPPALRRLTAVIDALGYNVPIPVWDAANRTPERKTGKLPPTGVLSQLLKASESKQTARTALLAMQSIGDFNARDAHLIPLGDAIKSLRRVGLGSDAKRLAFEAVFDSWPRPN